MGSLVKSANPLNFMGDAIGGVSSIATTAMNNRQQERTNNANMAMNMQNLQFNKEEAEKSRQFNAQQNALQNQFNAEQAKLAFDRSSAFEREMWQKENEYNTPKAQIERLQAAGLNPNLFGGDNTASSVGAASSPAASGSALSGSPASAPSMIPMQTPPSILNPLLESSQIALNKAQAEKLGSDTDLNKAQINRINTLLSGEEEEQRIRINQSKWNLEKLSPAELNNLESNTNFVSKQASKLDTDISYLNEQIKLIGEQQKLTGEQLRRAKIENQNLDDILKSQIRNNLLQGDLYIGQKHLTEEQASYYAEEATNAIINGMSLCLDYEKSAQSKDAEIKIRASENAYMQSLADWKANNPRLAIAFDECGALFGAIGRGVSSTIKVVGASIAK